MIIVGAALSELTKIMIDFIGGLLWSLFFILRTTISLLT
jgi:hypothetical protein